MKKRTAIFFVMLANIILLAHAVVPHHHHLPHQAFLITSQCSEDKNEHHHPVTDFDHDHENDNKSNNELCLLNRIIGLPANAVRQICGVDFQSDFQPNFSGFYAVLIFFQFKCVAPAVIVRPPLFVFSYISYATSVLGLRAPPAI